jgi:hypothetical protein
LTPTISALEGCQGVTVFGDDFDGEYGLFVLWDSLQHADAAARVIGPQLQKHLEGNVAKPPERRLFQVLSS